VAKQWSPLVGVLVSSVTAIGLVLAPFTPTSASAATVQVSKPDASLTATWWEKIMAIPGDSLGRCDVGTGKILFLAGTAGGSAIRSCETDKNFFLVPLINVECSESEPPDFFQTYAEQRACAKGFADAFTDLKLVIDGHPFDGDFHSLRVQAKGHFTPVEGNIFGTPPANNSKFAADGYWALIKLTPDVHTLTFGGSYVPVPGEPPAFTTDVTYTLTVQN
jgi:hypothetical protein